MRFLALFLAAAAFFATVARADPPIASHDHWRNTNYPSHYVLYEPQSASWVETVDCRVVNRFREVSNALNTLTLYDQSRDMAMRLTYDGMYLKAHGAADFSLYQYGTFDTRKSFRHADGVIAKRNACAWEEWFPGGSQPAFRFVQSGVDAAAVELYDSSRDIGVRLENGQMLLRQGNAPFSFIKSGRWE